LIIFLYFYVEKRAVLEVIARDNQIREMFADLDTNGDSLYVLFIFKSILYLFFNRVSIDELQKHTELDTEGENEFTVEEVRVNIFICI
jgi:hypothetical protein